VQASSFQSYLSAVNKAHEHCDVPAVAKGSAVANLRRSLAAAQRALVERETRVRIPADEIGRVLDAALVLTVSADPRHRANVLRLRGSVAVVVDFCAGSRGNTGVHLRAGDVSVAADGAVSVRLRALKGAILVDALSGNEKVIAYPPDAIAGYVDLIQKWEDLRQALGLCEGGAFASQERDSWYRLPWESATWRWNVGQMNGFMSAVLTPLGIVAAATFVFSWHSLRHGAASSQSAINVAQAKIMWLQNWANMAVALATYIDPLCPATAGCYRFFGWLLPPSPADVARLRRPALAVACEPLAVPSL